MKIWLHTGKGAEAYILLEDEDEIIWASSKDTRKGDIVLMYRGFPHSDIAYIFKAKGDAHDDEYYRKKWRNACAVDIHEKISIPQTIKIDEMRKNPILRKWGVVRKNFRGSFFEVPPKEWNEIKRLILEKNPELKDKIDELEKRNSENDLNQMGDYYDFNAGRAHIVRDLSYLISKHENLTEKELFDLLRESVGNNEDYWKAYYQRSNKENSPKYNLNSTRTLNLVQKDELKLTDLGKELVSKTTEDELFTHNYGLETKRFFYKLASKNDAIKKAMEILKKKKKLRFWAPTCDLTNKVVWEFHKEGDRYYCEHKNHPQCNNCDRDLLVHIGESSLPFETYKQTGKDSGFVFWMCSRVTPMHLTGSEPVYSGNYIYWDYKAEKELEPEKEVFIQPSDIKTNLEINPKIKEQVCGALNSKKHIMLTGAPGTGKTNLAEDICKAAHDRGFSDGYILTTATSDWTTFDTIGGYMLDKEGYLKFEDGKFLQAIRDNKWLIIDEINRADIDKAFGQLFTVLSGQGVELPFKINGNSVKIEPSDENRTYYDPEISTYKVGKNWRIIATMNVYDKDYLFEMSYAFMRRFTFVYIDLPEYEGFKELINQWTDDLSEESIESIQKLLEINKYRQIGPAIFKDIAEYVKEREKIGNKDHVIEDAVISYILPQFEGLEDSKIRKIWNILKSTFEDNVEIKRRLEEISGIELEKSQSE